MKQVFSNAVAWSLVLTSAFPTQYILIQDCNYLSKKSGHQSDGLVESGIAASEFLLIT
jgi:hypothetical protein